MKAVPKFKNEEEEREFWGSHETTEFFDWSKAKRAVFPNLKPTLKTISIRLPADLLEQYKALANKEDVPYQSLMKMALSERIKRERKKTSSRKTARTVKTAAQ